MLALSLVSPFFVFSYEPFLIRDGSYENTKNGETRLNASIVNLNMDKIKILK